MGAALRRKGSPGAVNLLDLPPRPKDARFTFEKVLQVRIAACRLGIQRITAVG